MLMSETTAQLQHLLDEFPPEISPPVMLSWNAVSIASTNSLAACSIDNAYLRQVAQTDDVLQKALIRLHAALKGVKPHDVRTFYGLAARQIAGCWIGRRKAQAKSSVTRRRRRSKKMAAASRATCRRKWSDFHRNH